jgi:hypothetical protein
VYRFGACCSSTQTGSAPAVALRALDSSRIAHQRTQPGGEVDFVRYHETRRIYLVVGSCRGEAHGAGAANMLSKFR